MSNKPQFVGERVSFADVFSDVSRGVKKFKQGQYANRGAHPIVDQGQELIAGYSDEETGLFTDVPAIVFGDHTRCVKYVEEPFFAGADGVKILKPKLSDNTRFWWHSLKATPIENLGYSRHFKLLKAATFKTYDTASQAEIVARLDSILDQIAQADQQIGQLNQLVKSRFVEMFGDPVLNDHFWRMAPLGENAKLINGRAYKQDELLATGKYPVLRVGNFFSNRNWYYSDLELKEDKYCGYGDLLYAWSASFGPQIWNGGKVIYHYHIWKIEVGDSYNKVFLCKLLRYAEKSFLGDTHGIGMMHLTKSGMEETHFIVPPLALQQEFAAFVAQVDKSRFVAQQQIEKLQMLYDSLAQDYFG